MKHFSFMLMAAVTVISCGLHEIGGEGETGDEVWTGSGGGVTAEPAMRSRCYVTCLDYQDGYDWRADSEKGSVKCSLVVFSDGAPVMKVPVGDAYEVSPDPDMHRIVSGHLVTDYATDQETIVKVDGVESFRYYGRDIIKGVLIRDGNLYTLGQSRSGDGFSLRLNGEVLVERDNGYVLGSLYEDGDSICFAFAERVISSGNEIERYYDVIDGEVTQVGLRNDIRKVWDVLNRGGRRFILASLTGIRSPVIIVEDKLIAIETVTSSSVLSCRLFPVGQECGVEGIYSFMSRYQYSALWLDGVIHRAFDVNHVISSLSSSGDGVCCLVNPVGGLDKGIIFRNGEEFRMPPGYAAMGDACAVMVDGILYAGLSSPSRKKPVIWKDGALDTLNINGFISGLSVEKVRK